MTATTPIPEYSPVQDSLRNNTQLDPRLIHNIEHIRENNISFLLVSPPLHLSLIVAGIVSLLALGQVRNTTELLVVVHGLVFNTKAVNSI